MESVFHGVGRIERRLMCLFLAVRQSAPDEAVEATCSRAVRYEEFVDAADPGLRHDGRGGGGGGRWAGRSPR